MTTSVFSDKDMWDKWAVKLQFRDKLLGGIPRDPKVIEGWLRAKAGVDKDWEVQQMMRRTLQELGVEVPQEATLDQLLELSETMAANQNTVGFKVDDNGLYVEERQVKAMLKEVTNVLFAGEKWGKTRKGPKGYLAERVFVTPSRISLGRKEPDNVELVIGHVTGPQGPRSVLAYHEYVEQATIEFKLMVVKGTMDTPGKKDPWRDMWLLAQENGLGALRSQGHGRFDVIRWDKL
jgi:hypothetical protein